MTSCRETNPSHPPVIPLNRVFVIITDLLLMVITWRTLPARSMQREGNLLNGKGLVDIMLRNGGSIQTDVAAYCLRHCLSTVDRNAVFRVRFTFHVLGYRTNRNVVKRADNTEYYTSCSIRSVGEPDTFRANHLYILLT